MYELKRLDAAPPNVADYVREILPGFMDLYGPEAADYYAQTATVGIASTIANANVLAFACLSGDSASAMLFVKRDETRTILSFLHVLEPHRDAGVGEALLRYALESMAEEPREVMTEFIPFHPVALDQLFECYGFTKIERQLMRSPTGVVAPAYPSRFEFTHPSLSDLEALGAVLTETYVGHSERFLFPEVQSRSKALAYLTRAVNGHFGPFVPGFAIAAWKDGQCAGFGVGCQVLPGLGFVLHLAVRPAFQGNGIGTGLLQALSAAFARHGLNYIALGVTCDNPAVKLYRRTGFTRIAAIPVYFRPSGTPQVVSP